MFNIQGRTCTQKSSIEVIIKKKPIQISLYINKPLNFSPEPGNSLIFTNNRGRSESFNPDSNLSEVTSPKAKPSLLSSKKLSQTPTPCKSPNLKYSYMRYEFDPPITHKKRVASQIPNGNREESRNNVIRQRKGISAGNNAKSVKQHDDVKKKITMKDLKVNLPSIVKSKRYKHKVKYRPSITQTYI